MTLLSYDSGNSIASVGLTQVCLSSEAGFSLDRLIQNKDISFPNALSKCGLMSTGEKETNFTLFYTVVSPGVMLWLKDSFTEDWRLMSHGRPCSNDSCEKGFSIAITISMWMPLTYVMETELWQTGCS